MAKLDLKEELRKRVNRIFNNAFVFIWIAFIASLAILTLFFKEYVKSMIVISIMFVLFWFLEPIMYGIHGKSITSIFARGSKIPRWEIFPLFFLEVILLYIVYSALQTLIDYALPAAAVNFVLVLLWVGFLFVLWHFYFSVQRYE